MTRPPARSACAISWSSAAAAGGASIATPSMADRPLKAASVTVRLESLSIFYSFKAIRCFTLAGHSLGDGATPVATSRQRKDDHWAPAYIPSQGIGVPTHGSAGTFFLRNSA